jgi:AAA15 family ATPase/GTPase
MLSKLTDLQQHPSTDYLPFRSLGEVSSKSLDCTVMMLSKLTIENYKSVRKLDINTSRVNLFIGEHNSGKSNILEALSWFSINALSTNVFQDLFRFKTATDFFFDSDPTKPVRITSDYLNLILRYAKSSHGALHNEIEGLVYPTDADYDFSTLDDFYNLNHKTKESNYNAFRLSFDGKIESLGTGRLESSFRTYIFKKLKSFERNFRPFLNPPFGENIPSLLVSNKEYKDLVSSVFRERGFRLMVKPTEIDINMAKEVDDELYAYPYTSISETLQRIIFYLLAIESNKDASLIFDEPDSNTFPMYTKQLAELIAQDNSNQYFIATHNPYLLNSLVTKTPAKQLSVFLTKMDQYETTVVKLDEKDLAALLDQGIDVYFNLDKLISD